jgi:hypothetical protein
MNFRGLFAKVKAALNPEQGHNPVLDAAAEAPTTSDFSLPKGRIFWEIRANGVPALDLGDYVRLDRDWHRLADERRAVASAAAPQFAHLYRNGSFPASVYRHKPEQFPSHLMLKPSAPKKKKLPEYSAIGTDLVVSARVAEIIAGFEGDRFNFIPFTCSHPTRSSVYSFCFWQPNEVENIDIVHLERSGYRQVEGPHGQYWSQDWRLVQPPLILDADKVIGRHYVKTGNYGMPGHRLISDELKYALGEFLPASLVLVEARAI